MNSNRIVKDLVSVIVPTYKRKTILRAINSILEQDYKSIEIIVVDDNAEHLEYRNYVCNILKPFLDENKITLIKNETNLGGALSRNKGIEYSHGEYIAFLDDDDWYLPQKISKQVTYIKERDADIVYCYSKGVDLKGNVVWENKKNKEGNLLYEAMVTDCIASTSLILCRRKAIFDAGLFPNIPCRQDVVLELNMAIKNCLFVCVPEILTVYGDADPSVFRISNISKKTLVGYDENRRIARNNYNRLTKHQVKQVEMAFSHRICLISLLIKDKASYKAELTNMIKTSFFDMRTVKAIIKFIFWNHFICGM